MTESPAAAIALVMRVCIRTPYLLRLADGEQRAVAAQEDLSVRDGRRRHQPLADVVARDHLRLAARRAAR